MAPARAADRRLAALRRRRPHPPARWLLGAVEHGAGLDGTAAMSGRVGALSSPRVAELFRRLRSVADVVLVGAETVRRERYGPIRLDEDLLAARRQRGQGRSPVRRRDGIARPRSRPPAVRAAPPLIMTSARQRPSRRAALEARAEVVVAGDDRVDLAMASPARPPGHADRARARAGRRARRAHRLDLLDEYCLTLAPLIGGDPLPAVDTVGSPRCGTSVSPMSPRRTTRCLRYLRKEAA